MSMIIAHQYKMSDHVVGVGARFDCEASLCRWRIFLVPNMIFYVMRDDLVQIIDVPISALCFYYFPPKNAISSPDKTL